MRDFEFSTQQPFEMKTTADFRPKVVEQLGDAAASTVVAKPVPGYGAAVATPVAEEAPSIAA